MDDSCKVIPFPKPVRPHLAGVAICKSCKHAWAATAPIGTRGLECTSCGLARGKWRDPIVRGETLWRCNCGCYDLRMTPAFLYCCGCGAEAIFS